jgi:hypothetical protein
LPENTPKYGVWAAPAMMDTITKGLQNVKNQLGSPMNSRVRGLGRGDFEALRKGRLAVDASQNPLFGK